MKKIIDCFIYNGEIDICNLRITELSPVVDEFWIIEGCYTFTGIPKDLQFEAHQSTMSWPKSKIKYFPFTTTPVADPWENEYAQRNHLGKLVEGCSPHDLLMYSDVDEIPRPESVVIAANGHSAQCFGFEMSTHYFRLNYTLLEPEVLAKSVWTVAFSPLHLKEHTVDELRMGIRNRTIPAVIIKKAGWHFSYLMSDEQIVKKIKSFSHQELNTPQIIQNISVKRMLANREDLFSRDGFTWGRTSIHDLPETVLKNLGLYKCFLYKANFSLSFWFNRFKCSLIRNQG